MAEVTLSSEKSIGCGQNSTLALDRFDDDSGDSIVHK